MLPLLVELPVEETTVVADLEEVAVGEVRGGDDGDEVVPDGGTLLLDKGGTIGVLEGNEDGGTVDGGG